MKRMLVIVTLSMFLIASQSMAITVDVKPQENILTRGATLYVGGSGTNNYTKIQDAINDSINGDTVFVYDDSSPYFEMLKVNKSIYLIGENKETTIIEGNENVIIDKDGVVNISADNVTLSGFTIQNASNQIHRYPSGIYITSSFNTIYENIITKNYFGISVGYWYFEDIRPAYNNISNNIITNSDNIGIYLDDCNHTIVWNNIISEARFGIFLGGIHNSSISRNIITKNEVGVSYFMSGWLGFRSIISYNNISDNEKYGIQLSDSPTIITYNNFMNNGRNAAFSYMAFELLFNILYNGGFSTFNRNYWDRERILPYPILGYITVWAYLFHWDKLHTNWVHFDRNPASEPYDIGGLL